MSARLALLAQGLAGSVGGPGDHAAVAAAAATASAASAADLGLTAPVTGELPAAVIAARYAKADLVSQVVIEFPSLQGRVGGVYAGKAGAAPAVARAIAEHYLPLSAVAPIPGTLAGGLVAIAEKIDNIAGAWIAAEKPSGSRDPYGLRRAAMGIVRIALENDLHIVPCELADIAFTAYAGQGKAEPQGDPRAEIAAFVWERLQGLLLDEGLPFPLVEAALGAAAPPAGSAGSIAAPGAGSAVPNTAPNQEAWSAAASGAASGTASSTAPDTALTPSPADLPRVAALARAFARLESEPFFNDVVVAFTRPAALAAKAAAEPGGVPAAPDPALFAAESEHALAAALAEVREPFVTALAGGDVEAALLAAAALRGPIDRYFDDVLVMDKDPAARGNRLAQLTQITTLLGSLGDFSRLPVHQG